MRKKSLKRGWCPGVLRPMLTGDGLLVRLRLRAGRFDPKIARLIANAARDFGNGEIDLSQRANLQLRGVGPDGMAALTAILRDAGLVDADEITESARNIICSPASDLDPHALIDAQDWLQKIEIILAEIVRKSPLPAKFGILIDDGGKFSLDQVYADIRLKARQLEDKPCWHLALAGDGHSAKPVGLYEQWQGLALVRLFCEAAIKLFPEERPNSEEDVRHWVIATGFMPKLGTSDMPGIDGIARSANDYVIPGIVALRPAFGRLNHGELLELADCLQPASRASFRLTPNRDLLVGPVSNEERDKLEKLAHKFGFITKEDDPLRHVSACVGSPACGNATTPVREDARKLAIILKDKLEGTASLHVSGCAKGCARREVADIVLTGENGSYRLAYKAKAGDGAEILPFSGIADIVLHQTSKFKTRPGK